MDLKPLLGIAALVIGIAASLPKPHSQLNSPSEPPYLIASSSSSEEQTPLQPPKIKNPFKDYALSPREEDAAEESFYLLKNSSSQLPPQEPTPRTPSEYLPRFETSCPDISTIEIIRRRQLSRYI